MHLTGLLNQHFTSYEARLAQADQTAVRVAEVDTSLDLLKKNIVDGTGIMMTVQQKWSEKVDEALTTHQGNFQDLMFSLRNAEAHFDQERVKLDDLMKQLAVHNDALTQTVAEV